MKIKLSENIKRLRTERGILQKEFAEALSVTPQSVSRWETGQAYPDIEMLPRIADFFDLSIDELLGVGMSFAARKKQQLDEVRSKVKGENDFHNRRRVCSILEELAANGDCQIKFFREALSLYHLGGIGIESVERAREYCREMLSKCAGDERIRNLQNILLIEEEQNVERWREFVSNDSFLACWDDLLLWRYAYGTKHQERWEQTRQNIVHASLWKLIQSLICGVPDHSQKAGSFIFHTLNPYENYKAALETLDLFSHEEGDVYLDLRIYVEIRMAAVLFGTGQDAAGFATLERLTSHIRTFEKLKNKMRRGSVSFLSEIERFTSGIDIKNCISDVCLELRRAEFNCARHDARFLHFSEMVEEICRET